MFNRAALIGMMLLMCFSMVQAADEKRPAHIVPDKFEELAKEKDAVILDVRTPEEFKAGHIKGAVNIDYMNKNFDEQIKPLEKGKTYLIYCASGARSQRAGMKLMKAGAEKVYNLQGGLETWKQAKKPLEQ